MEQTNSTVDYGSFTSVSARLTPSFMADIALAAHLAHEADDQIGPASAKGLEMNRRSVVGVNRAYAMGNSLCSLREAAARDAEEEVDTIAETKQNFTVLAVPRANVLLHCVRVSPQGLPVGLLNKTDSEDCPSVRFAKGQGSLPLEHSPKAEPIPVYVGFSLREDGSLDTVKMSRTINTSDVLWCATLELDRPTSITSSPGFRGRVAAQHLNVRLDYEVNLIAL